MAMDLENGDVKPTYKLALKFKIIGGMADPQIIDKTKSKHASLSSFEWDKVPNRHLDFVMICKNAYFQKSSNIFYFS